MKLNEALDKLEKDIEEYVISCYGCDGLVVEMEVVRSCIDEMRE